MHKYQKVSDTSAKRFEHLSTNTKEQSDLAG